MPGVNIAIESDSSISLTESNTNGYANMYGDFRDAINETNMAISLKIPESYPYSLYQIDGFQIILEGKVYGHNYTDTKDLLLELVNEAKNHRFDALSNKLWDVDGEFVIYCFTEEELLVINDSLGRLPLYYDSSEECRVIARDLDFIEETLDNIRLNKIKLAERILFRYPVGEDTIFKNISTLGPGSCLEYNFEREELTTYNNGFKIPQYNSNNIGKNAKKLSTLFRQACRRRACSEKQNVIGLSGGLDSRAVAAGFSKENLNFVARTRSTPIDSNSDIEYAEELAETFGWDWDAISYDAISTTDMRYHIQTTYGRDPLHIAHIHGFFNRLKSEDRELQLVTGDGGDKFLPDLTPGEKLAGLDELVEYIISQNKIMEEELVCDWVGISREDLVNDIKSVIQRYPQKTLSKLYVNYTISERGMNWLYSAEDTNRSHFWSTSPFYAQDFVKFALTCPPEQKRRFKLYSKFLSDLSPRTTQVDNANYGVPPNTLRHEGAILMYNSLKKHPRVLERVKPYIKAVLGNRDGFVEQEPINKLLDEYRMIDHWLIDDDIIDYAKKSTSRREVYQILTIFAAIDELYNEKPILSEEMMISYK